MKTLLLIFSLLCAVSVQAQNIITATITTTNTAGIANSPTNTLVINGVTRTATNAVTSAGTQFLSSTNISGATSNIFISLTSVRPPNADVFTSSTNIITIKSFIGSPMAVTIGGAWGTVSLSTNTVTAATVIRAPMAVAGNYERTNVESAIVDYLNDNKGSNTVSASSNPFTNFVNTSTAQTVAGVKIFTGANVYSNASQQWIGGTITNAVLSNCVPALTNGYASNLILSNGVNYGLPFRSPGGGAESEQFGFGASALTDAGLAVGNTALAGGSAATALGASTVATNQAVAVGANATASGLNSIAIGSTAASLGNGSIALGQSAECDADNSIAIGKSALCGYSNSVAIGGIADQASQVKLGGPASTVSIPGYLQVDSGISNAVMVGSLKLNNELLVTAFNNTSLASGNNAGISASTNAYVTIPSGPAALFTIAGIAGGASGRVVTLENTTGQSMVLANESGLDATAANRIRTGLSADLTVTNNPGTVTLRYSGTLSRWVVISKN